MELMVKYGRIHQRTQFNKTGLHGKEVNVRTHTYAQLDCKI
jgi:hypothetical protein